MTFLALPRPHSVNRTKPKPVLSPRFAIKTRPSIKNKRWFSRNFNYPLLFTYLGSHILKTMTPAKRCSAVIFLQFRVICNVVFLVSLMQYLRMRVKGPAFAAKSHYQPDGTTHFNIQHSSQIAEELCAFGVLLFQKIETTIHNTITQSNNLKLCWYTGWS